MLLDIKNIIKQSTVYGLSRISIKFVAFVLFPVYSIYFTVDEYGVIVRGEIFWQLFQSVLFYAIETALVRWYALIDDENKKKSLVFTVFFILLILNLILLLIALIFPYTLSLLIFNSQNYPTIIILCILVSIFETLIGIPLLILRIGEKAFKYTTFVISSSLISMILQIYFILYTDYKLEGIFVSKAIAPFLVFIFLLPLLLKSMSFKIDKNIAKEVWIFCYPLMLASFVSMLLNTQDRFILGYLTDSREVGLYGLACNIAGILTFLLISPFALAFPVIFWKKINDNNAGRFFTKSMTYSYFLLVWAALLLSLIIPHFIKIFAQNPDYWAAKNVVPFIAFSLVFYGMQVVGFMSFYYYKKTNIVLLILSISTIINLFLNIILIPIFKIYGAGISTFISFLVSVILIYLLSKKYYFIRWENYKLISSMILGILLTVPFYLINFPNIIVLIILKLCAIILFPIILYFFNFYEEIELITIKNYILKKINRGL